MRHLELFAGIGGFRRAMDILTNDHIMEFHCIGYSEIDSKAEATYRSNYAIGKDEIVMGDIVAFTNSEKNIKSLPDFDLLTGGFPCQTFSMMGKQAGFDEDRGQMFFRIMDILTIKKPKYVLLENVKNLRNHDKGKTFDRIKSELESIGYYVYADIFNTADFHLPQTRNRVLIFATTIKVPKNFQFSAKLIEEEFGDHMEIIKYNMDDRESVYEVRNAYDEVVNNIIDFNQDDYGFGPFLVLDGYFAQLGVEDVDYFLENLISAINDGKLGEPMDNDTYYYFKDGKIKGE